MSELVCPGCGEPAEYRVPRRQVEDFRAGAEYQCGPHEDGYVYLHAIPPQQAITAAYPWLEASP